jgi:hypothetical protein
MKVRWLLAAAIAAYFVAVAVWMASDRRVAREAFDDFSAANTDDTGLSLSSRYLRARMLTQPLAVGTVEGDAVVFRVGSFGSGFTMLRDLAREEEGGDEEDDGGNNKQLRKHAPKKPRQRIAKSLLTADEEDFVRGGGRLVLAIGGMYGPLDVRKASQKTMTKVFPLWRGLGSIPMPAPRTLAGSDALRHAPALYVAGDVPAMARLPIGRGDVILSAQPELFDNAHIGSNNSLALLSALAGRKRPVYFDETVHGLFNGGGMVDLLRQWNLGPLLLLLLILTGALFWRYGRRIGAPEDDYRDTRSDAVDLVASLGALYDRTMTDGEALALYHQALSRSVAAHTGLRGDPLHKRVAELTGNDNVSWKHEKLDRESFHRRLMTINQAFRRVERG